MLRRMTSTIFAASLLAAPCGLQAQQEWTLQGRELLVTDLIGKVTVRGHDGPGIVVRARPGGRDAGQIRFETRQDGRAEFHAIFPLRESLRYVYPALGHSRTSFTVRSWERESSVLERALGAIGVHDHVEVYGQDRSGALEAWADLEILVPEGVPIRVRVGVGDLEAAGVRAALDLDGTSGTVTARDIRGDTRIDTGSGSVEATTVRGDLNVDTGSGDVRARDVEGGTLHIDTGSGSATADGVRVHELYIDTGSGEVDVTEATVDESKIDTGSGSVSVSLTRLDRGSHDIDTGSGPVTVFFPPDASVRIRAETSSGGIRVDVPAARLRKMSRDEVELEIGDAAAYLHIDTGSGTVSIRAHT